MASAGIVIIGDEILSGKFVEENAQFLIGELRSLGVDLRRITMIPDDLADIAATVTDASARFDHVFTSGGVGPTHDDVTIAAIAKGFGTTVT
ncbi:MAG: molybdopterin-binding protein, partial [Acidobacteriota bacterium]